MDNSSDDDNVEIDDEVYTDANGRAYSIIKGSRAQFKDYTLSLGNAHVQLQRFVVISDTNSKKQCYIVQRECVDRREGMVHHVAMNPYIKNEEKRTNFCNQIVREEISRSTTMWSFQSKSYRLSWKSSPIKAIFRDFGE